MTEKVWHGQFMRPDRHVPPAFRVSGVSLLRERGDAGGLEDGVEWMQVKE